MLIQYCESCGVRVSESDFQNGALQMQDKAYCQKCAVAVPKQKKPPTGSTHVPPRAGDKVSSNTRLPALNKPSTGRTAPVAAKHSSHTSTSAVQKKNSGMPVFAIAGVAAVLLAGGALFMSKQKPAKSGAATTITPETKPAEPVAKKDPPVAAQTPPVQTSPPVQNPPPVTTTLDPKEDFARRKWAELKESEKKQTPYQARKDVESFVATYGSTAAGKEAAQYLVTMPPGEAPVAPETKILWQSDFEHESDDAMIGAGKRGTDNAYGGKGSSLKSVVNASDYFTSMITLSPRVNNTDMVKISESTWVRLAIRVEGAYQICFHTSIGGSVYEKYAKGLALNKWHVITFKLSDHKTNITNKNAPKPVPGTTFNSTTIFGCQKNAPTTVYIDSMMIGDGPIPPEPK
jgi:hypothetical protein